MGSMYVCFDYLKTINKINDLSLFRLINILFIRKNDMCIILTKKIYTCTCNSFFAISPVQKGHSEFVDSGLFTSNSPGNNKCIFFFSFVFLLTPLGKLWRFTQMWTLLYR